MMHRIFTTCAHCPELATARRDGTPVCDTHRTATDLSMVASLMVFAIIAGLGVTLFASAILTGNEGAGLAGLILGGWGGILSVLSAMRLWN